MAIIGGSKVSTKLGLLDNLLGRVDRLIIGGGIANTFLAATGHPVGKSLYEPDLIDASKEILAKAEKLGKPIPLPVDVVTAPELAPGQKAVTCGVDEVASDQMILDIGRTLEYLETMGVPVLGLNTDEFPAFYCRKSGYKVDFNVESPEMAANILHTKWEAGMEGGADSL